MTAHKHAALMLQYAQDAAETDTPWERWEYKRSADLNTWFPATLGFGWLVEFDYRRKACFVKTETRTYECLAHVNGSLHWFEQGETRELQEQWRRVPSLDKTVEVVPYVDAARAAQQERKPMNEQDYPPLPKPDGTAEANKVPHPSGGYEYDEIDAWSEPLVRAYAAACVAADRAQQERKPMTHDDRLRITNHLQTDLYADGDEWDNALIDAVEAFHGIKETP